MASRVMGTAERLEEARQRRQARIRRYGNLWSPTEEDWVETPATTLTQAAKPTAAVTHESDADFLTRFGSTLADAGIQVGAGVVDALEGVVDTAIGIGGAVGGLFDEDIRDAAQDLIAHDFTGENILNPTEGVREASYLNDGKAGEIAQNVLRGVGGMLPAVAVTVATGGLGAAPAVAQGLGLATMGVGAAGGSTEEAYNDGAEYYQGLGYGLASGAVEVATEKLLGGATKGIFGKGMLDDIGRSVADTGVKRVVKDAAGEAFEEAVAEVASPVLKAIYKGRDGFAEYGDPAFLGNVGNAALVGGLTSVAFGGTVGRLTGSTGRAAEIGDSLAELEGLRRKQGNLFANDKLTEATQEKLRTASEANLRNIEHALQKSSAAKRTKLMEQFGLADAFDADGSLKPDYAARYLGEQTAASDGTVLDKRYVSPDLWSRADAVQADLQTITDDLRMRSGKDALRVEVFSGSLSETGRAAYVQMKKSMAKLSEKTRTGMNFVLLNPNDRFDGAILTDGNTLYITADTLENGTWAGKVVHEVTHFAEGSKAYASMIRSFARDEALVGTIAEKLTARGNGYGFDAGTLRGLLDKAAHGARLEGTERALMSEINAHMTEAVLGNESFIARLVREESTLAEKMMGKLRRLCEAFERLTDPNARKEYNRLRTAEKLYLKAVEDAGWNYVAGKIKKAQGETDANLQKKVSFSLKDGIVYIDTDQDIFNGVDRKDYGKTVRTYMRTHFRGKRVSDTVFTKISEREYTASKYTQGIYSSEDGIYEAKMQASTELNKIVSAGKFIGHEDAKHPHNHNGNGYDRFEVIFNLDGEDFRGEMLIAIDKDDKRTFYDIVNIKRSATDRAADIADHDGSASVEKQHISHPSDVQAPNKTPNSELSLNTVPINSIPQKSGNVKGSGENNSENIRYSMKKGSTDGLIEVGMTDDERIAILRNKTIKPSKIKISDGFDMNFADLEKNRKSIVEKALMKNLRELGCLKSYNTGSVDESLNLQEVVCVRA